jgi:hypothetical protein
VVFLVPGSVIFGSAEAERAAQIYDAGAGGKHDGRQFHGDVCGSGQKNHGKSSLSYSFAGTRYARWRCGAADSGSGGFLAVIQQDRLHLSVTTENLKQFRTAIASIAYDSHSLHV